MYLKKSVFAKQLLYVMFLISLLPPLLLFLDNDSVNGFWYKFANISGYIGGVVLFWQFLLGIRGVVKRFTFDYDWAIKVHTFLGINGAIFVLIHPFLETMVYLKDIRFIFGLDFSTVTSTQISVGRLAFILFLVVWFTSSMLRKAYKYRTWLYIHYLSYPLLFFTLIHPFIIGSFLQNNVFIYYYWVLLCLLSVVFVILKFLDILNISYTKYKLTDLKILDGGVFTLKYSPTEKSIIPAPGQYFYIKKYKIGEAHPFSVLEYDNKTGEVTFGVKDLGKYTHELLNSKIGELHYLDGSFGEFTFEGFNEDPKIILAGGIGVTPFYELVKKYGNDKTYMFYANQKLSYAIYRDKFKKLLGSRYYDFISQEKISEDNVICNQINNEQLRNILPKEFFKTGKFFICGSPAFMNSVISCLLEFGVIKSQIFTEEFGY